jgi:type II secretory ATPase GspE/PulE/Tfp pilus assembly ATPase PilB-like protein
MIEAINPEVKKLLDKWGWNGDAPDSVCQFAELVDKINPTGQTLTGAIAEHLGYVNLEKIANSGESVAPREAYFSFLSRIVPGVRRHEAEIMAIKDRLAYYGRLPALLEAHACILDDNVRDECAMLGCLPVHMPTGRVSILFSSLEEMLRFRQRSSSVEAVSPLSNALQQERITSRDLLFAFAAREEITTPLRNAKKEDASVEGGQSMGRLIYADRNRGQERALAVDILENGVARKATDISLRVLSTGEGEIFYRENSVRLYSYKISMLERMEVTNYLMQASGANSTGARLMKPSTGRLIYKGQSSAFEMRCSFIPGDQRQAFHEDDQVVSISMRYLEQEAGDGFVDINKLGFDDDVRDHLISALNVKRGILLLVGPTNSGKSTTLAAFLGQHYKMFGDTVKRLSLEDPKERTIIGVEQFSLPNADVYEPYLEGFLRHDPDVILLSEIRSRASAETATRAALTGHLVLSTFHASDPVEGFTSLAHLMSEERQHDLLQALVMIITQRLVPRLCPVCSESRLPTEDEWAKFRYGLSLRGLNADDMDIDKTALRFAVSSRTHAGHKCDKCRSTGYVGVFPIHGILDFTKEVKAVLRDADFDRAAEFQRFNLDTQAIKALNRGLIDLSGAST